MKQLSGSEFCSAAHRDRYIEKQNQLAVERLAEARTLVAPTSVNVPEQPRFLSQYHRPEPSRFHYLIDTEALAYRADLCFPELWIRGTILVCRPHQLCLPVPQPVYTPLLPLPRARGGEYKLLSTAILIPTVLLAPVFDPRSELLSSPLLPLTPLALPAARRARPPVAGAAPYAVSPLLKAPVTHRKIRAGLSQAPLLRVALQAKTFAAGAAMTAAGFRMSSGAEVALPSRVLRTVIDAGPATERAIRPSHPAPLWPRPADCPSSQRLSAAAAPARPRPLRGAMPAAAQLFKLPCGALKSLLIVPAATPKAPSLGAPGAVTQLIVSLPKRPRIAPTAELPTGNSAPLPPVNPRTIKTAPPDPLGWIRAASMLLPEQRIPVRSHAELPAPSSALFALHMHPRPAGAAPTPGFEAPVAPQVRTPWPSVAFGTDSFRPPWNGTLQSLWPAAFEAARGRINFHPPVPVTAERYAATAEPRHPALPVLQAGIAGELVRAFQTAMMPLQRPGIVLSARPEPAGAEFEFSGPVFEPLLPRRRAAVRNEFQRGVFSRLLLPGGDYGRMTRSIIQPAARLWDRTPNGLKWAVMAVPLVLVLAGRSGVPSASLLEAADVQAGLSATATEHWQVVRGTIAKRAAIHLQDDFRAGLSSWSGAAGWAGGWSYDRTGFVRTGSLALFQPSLDLTDYSVEFLAQIERKSIGWVYRAKDLHNYYAAKIVIIKPGPMPKIGIERYAVINGKAGRRTVLPLPLAVSADTMFQVRLEVRGENFTTSIGSQVVDFWSDGRLKAGGIGFFSEAGERARLRWVEMSHQHDLLGKLCARLSNDSASMTERSLNR